MTGLKLSNVSKKYGSFVAIESADFELDDGKFVCFLGPSGCGKTTLLRLIAGLEVATTGEVHLGGNDITRLPTHERKIGMVFQSLALFPHLSVAENIAYGLRIRGVSKSEQNKRANELLEIIRLPHVADRSIEELSGGQRQRVAIARALALDPQLFLLDEPLSALDANLREEMQVELRQLQQRLGVTTIMVTHDQSEAMTTADIVVVMNEGKIVQIGHPLEIYRAPATAFVASFIGTNNLLEAVTADDGVVLVNDVAFGAGNDSEHRSNGENVYLSVRPEDVHLKGEKDSGANLLPGIVTFVRDLGSEVEAFIDCNGKTVIAKWIPKEDSDVSAGDPVKVELPQSSIRILSR